MPSIVSSLFFVGLPLLMSRLTVRAELVDYMPCGSNTFGLVESVDIAPCERGGVDEPCRFRFGFDYTITVEYTSLLPSGELPRASLAARDDSVQPSLRYPYSGQSFDACEYTACPIQGGQPSTWTYNFHTLQSRFNHLTINATTSLDGPSFLCVGFDALYLPSISGRRLKQ